MKASNDFAWILIVSIMILILSSIPTWAGYHAETSILRFRGLYYDSQDYAAHISMMEAGANGELAYQFRFTTEPMHPAYVRIFYVVLGHFSRWFGQDNELTFQMARWLFGIVALFSLYRLIQQVFQNSFWAHLTFLLAALGSGLGWLQLIFGWTSTRITPIDFWLIDSYVFFSLSAFPHFAFVTAGMCIVLGRWLHYIEKPNSKDIIVIILVTLLVQFSNPIAFATIDAAMLGAALFAAWTSKKINLKHVMGLIILAASQLPILAYNVMSFSYDALWSQYTSQHETPSPPPEYYLWGFALFLPFAVLGMISAFKKKSIQMVGFSFWVIAAFLLAYAPLYTQQRFLQNITIPLAILAIQGWMQIFEKSNGQNSYWMRARRYLLILFVFLASLSSIQLSLGRATYLQTHPEQFYYAASLDPAIVWLRKHARYNDFVLATESTSQVLAQKAGIRVYAGHDMETLNNEVKRVRVEAFFSDQLPQLATAPISWVVYGPEEQKINSNFSPPKNLDLVYETTDVKIYKVK